MKDHSCMIIAHRGESFEAPENTMAAIHQAWELGAEAVEIDVQLTKDNALVVIHDFNTNRLAGVNRKVKSQTLEELKRLDVGLWKDIQWKGERIPTLMEVLESVPKDHKLIIEIKSDQNTIPLLAELLNQTKLKSDQIIFIGFNLKTMAHTKQKFPEHKVLLLLELDYNWITKILKTPIVKAIKSAKKHNLDGLDVFAGDILNRQIVSRIQSSGLLVYTWTVNDVEKAKKLIDWGADAITTDGAHWLKTHIALNS